MTKFRMMLAVLLLLWLLPTTAAAHEVGPMHTELVSAGPYQLRIEFFSWPLRSGRSTNLLVTPVDGRYQQRQLALSGVLQPSTSVTDTARTLKVEDDNDSRNGYTFNLNPGTQGDWQLKLNVRGAQGSDGAILNLLVEGPPAIPGWLGWTVGLLPLWGLLGFFVAQGMKLRRLRGRLVEASKVAA